MTSWIYVIINLEVKIDIFQWSNLNFQSIIYGDNLKFSIYLWSICVFSPIYDLNLGGQVFQNVHGCSEVCSYCCIWFKDSSKTVDNLWCIYTINPWLENNCCVFVSLWHPSKSYRQNISPAVKIKSQEKHHD